MKLFHLLPPLLVYFCLYYLSNSANLGCKTFVAPVENKITLSADVIGICLSKRISSGGLTFETSRQFICQDNDNGGYNVIRKEYTNIDCIEDEETRSFVAQTNQEYIDCTSEVCPVYEVRVYSATPGDGNEQCIASDDFFEIAVWVNYCIYGYAYTCDDYGLYEWQFNDYNCSSYDYQIYQIYQTGCNSNGTRYSVTQGCSGGNTYSITIISIISSLFYIMSFINSL